MNNHYPGSPNQQPFQSQSTSSMSFQDQNQSKRSQQQQQTSSFHIGSQFPTSNNFLDLSDNLNLLDNLSDAANMNMSAQSIQDLQNSNNNDLNSSGLYNFNNNSQQSSQALQDFLNSQSTFSPDSNNQFGLDMDDNMNSSVSQNQYIQPSQTRSRAASTSSAYLTVGTELNIPGQYSLPTPVSNNNSRNASRNVSRNASARNSFNNTMERPNFMNQTQDHENFLQSLSSSAVVDDDYSIDQFLAPNAHTGHHRSPSIQSNASSAANSPAFPASSPLPLASSPYMEPVDSSGITGLELAMGGGFSINEPILSQSNSQNGNDLNYNQNMNSVNGMSNMNYDNLRRSSGQSSSLFQQSQSPSDASSPQLILVPPHGAGQPSQIPLSEPSVTTPEITIDVIDDHHSIHSQSPGVPSPYSDVESFTGNYDYEDSLHPSIGTRRRSHSESSVGHDSNSLTPNYSNFYLHSQSGSNVSLSSAVSDASSLAADEFLSPESAIDDGAASPGATRRRRTSRANSSSSSRNSLSPGRPGRPRGSTNSSATAKSRSRSRSVSRDHILEMASPSGSSRKTKRHPSQHKCDLCDKKFTRAYNLQSHLRTHNNEKPYKCSVCNKAFARQHDRKRHEDLHTGEKKYECAGVLLDGVTKWGCGHKFARADALGRHFRTEIGRQCIKPLVEEAEREKMQEQAKRLEEQNKQIQMQENANSINNTHMNMGNGQNVQLQQQQHQNQMPMYNAPSLTLSPPGAESAKVRKGVDLFPDSLLQQMPMLANMNFENGLNTGDLNH